MQRWLHDLFGLRLAGLIRYYPDERAALAALALRLNVARLPAFEQSCCTPRALATTLNVRMQLEQLLLAYQGACLPPPDLHEPLCWLTHCHLNFPTWPAAWTTCAPIWPPTPSATPC